MNCSQMKLRDDLDSEENGGDFKYRDWKTNDLRKTQEVKRSKEQMIN